ncbi:MAG: hypothetical protein LC790_19650, partial [Actinobacteria bacterium]|nr:hypothetical protein [Actinomycetota bacterium]MCA1700985.1 hypothetical protein [Actinomycetota bacterium]
APIIAPAEIDFEDHGYKHFSGRPHIKVKQGGAQWSLSVRLSRKSGCRPVGLRPSADGTELHRV